MRVLHFGNMVSFMLKMLWLSATGENMPLEKKLENISILRTVPLYRLLFILGMRFLRLIFRMDFNISLLARLKMSNLQ